MSNTPSRCLLAFLAAMSAPLSFAAEAEAQAAFEVMPTVEIPADFDS